MMASSSSSSSSSSFLNYFSVFKSEEIVSNDHFIHLIKQYKDIYLQAIQSDRVICCPTGSSLQGITIHRTDLESHVLIPLGGSGEFVSLNGEKVVFSGEDLIVNNSLRTRVLDVEYPPNQYDVIVYRVTNMITVGSSAIDEFDEVLPESFDRYISSFKSVPEAAAILTDLDMYLKKVCKLQRNENGKRMRLRSSLVAEIQSKWNEVTEALKELGMMSVVTNDDHDIRLGQVVETYMMNKIASTMLPWFKDSTYKADRAIHLQIMSLRDRTQSDLGVPAEFQTSHQNAIREICHLQHAQTPVDKLSILKRVSTLLRENVQKNFERNNYESDIELATDDLITIIIYIIIQASKVYIDIPADIRFILKFHFVPSSQSHLGFTLCNFRVAIAWFIDQVMLNEKVTVVSNSIMLSPSFTNTSVFGEDDLDFPRRPCLPVPNKAKKVVELLNMMTNATIAATVPVSPSSIIANDNNDNNDNGNNNNMNDDDYEDEIASCLTNQENGDHDDEEACNKTTNDNNAAYNRDESDKENNHEKREGKTEDHSFGKNDDMNKMNSPIRQKKEEQKTTQSNSPQHTHNFIAISPMTSSSLNHSQSNKWNQMLYILNNHSYPMVQQMKVPTEGGKKSFLKKTACRDRYYASIDSNGHLYTWGESGCGRLGHSLTFDLDSIIPNDKPKRVLGNLTDVSLQDVSLGRFHGVALSKEGIVYTWGDNRCGQIGLAANTNLLYDIDDIIGTSQELEIVRCGSRYLDDLTPLRSLERTLISTNENNSASCLSSLSFASSKCNDYRKKAANSIPLMIDKDTSSTMISKSTTSDLQLNFVSMQDLSYSVFVPRQVVSLNQIKVKAIACGSFHTLCLSERGLVFSWGRGANGRLGQPTSRLQGINFEQNTCLHQDDLSYAEPGYVIFPWIDKEFLTSLSSSSSSSSSLSSSDQLAMDENFVIVDVAAGHSHSIATTVTGQVYTWGCGSYGRLGHGDHCDEYLPKGIVTLLDADIKIMKVSAGAAHSVFLSECGQVYGCGLDNYSQVDALPLQDSAEKVLSPSTSPSPSPPLLSVGISPLSMPSSDNKTASDDMNGIEEFITTSCSKMDKISILYPLPVLVKSFHGTYKAASDTLQNNIERYQSYSETVVDIVCGDHFTIATTIEGSIYAWGLGYTKKNNTTTTQNDNSQDGSSSSLLLTSTSSSPLPPLGSSGVGNSSRNLVTAMSGLNKVLVTIPDEDFNSVVQNHNGSVLNISCGSDHALINCRPADY